MVNQVGSPAMLEGKRFFPLTGMPIWNRARSSTVLAVWLPEPLTVATWMLKSLTIGSTVSSRPGRPAGGRRRVGRRTLGARGQEGDYLGALGPPTAAREWPSREGVLAGRS